MVCIYCTGKTSVINSRPQKRLNRIWRRRVCLACGTTFTSIEALELAGTITVQSSNALEPFQRDKLLLSIYDSLKHRKTAYSDATGLTDTVISNLYPLMQDVKVQKTDITRLASQILQRFDKTAATHYQAFHPNDQ